MRPVWWGGGPALQVSKNLEEMFYLQQGRKKKKAFFNKPCFKHANLRLEKKELKKERKKTCFKFYYNMNFKINLNIFKQYFINLY